MARDQAQAPVLHRIVSVAAVGLLAGAAAVAFGRVFAPTGVTWKLLGVALSAVAVASVLERRSLALATLASGAGLVVAVALVVFPDTTFFGVPTASTFRAMLESLELVGHQARVEVAPTLPLQPLMLGAVTAVWTASFSAHALAIRSGSPFLAALPPAALLAFAGMVLEEGPRPAYALLFLVGLLTVLFSDGLQRVRQWGPLRPWTGLSSRRRAITATTTRGARRVAVLALAVAAFLPGILPGYGGPPILDVDGATGSGLVAVNPLVSVASNLRRRDAVELFTAQVNPAARTYWRLVALDRFDGEDWKPDDVALEGGEAVGALGALPRTGAPPTGATVNQTITIRGLTSSAYLPAAFDPIEVVADASVRFDPQASALFTPDGLEEGFRYAVVSTLPSPSPRDLDRVADLVGPDAERYTQLPEDFPVAVVEEARRITAGAATPFRQILAIQDHLRSFQYDVSVDYGNRSDAMLGFLTEERRGFCQQFAGTMAAMLRSLGIPSRVAVGFTPGSIGTDGLIHVTSHDYHAWVEVLFPGYGWRSFEPTPGRTNPVALPYQSVPAESGLLPRCVIRGCTPADLRRLAEGPGSANGATSAGRRSGTDNLDVIREGRFEPVPLPPSTPTRRSEPDGFPLRAVVLWGTLALAVLLVVVPLVKLGGRRLSVRRARRPRDLVLAAYGAFAGGAADLGLGRQPGETLWEHRARLRGGIRPSDGHLDRLTGITGRAAYSTRPVSEALAREAVDAARIAGRDLRRSVPLPRRVVGLYRIGR